LCNNLIEEGAEVRVHDPVVKELPSEWNSRVRRFESAVAALPGSRVLLIGTEWPEYKAISAEEIIKAAPGIIVLDPNRFLPFLAVTEALLYFSVGTPSTKVSK